MMNGTVKKNLARAAVVTALPASLLIGGATTQSASAGGIEVFGSESQCMSYRSAMIRQGYQMGQCWSASVSVGVGTTAWFVYVGEKVKIRR